MDDAPLVITVIGAGTAVASAVWAIVKHFVARWLESGERVAEQDREAARGALAAYDAVRDAWEVVDNADLDDEIEDALAFHHRRVAEFRRASLFLRSAAVRERLHAVAAAQVRLNVLTFPLFDEYIGSAAAVALDDEVEAVLGPVLRNMRAGIVQVRDLAVPAPMIATIRKNLESYEARMTRVRAEKQARVAAAIAAEQAAEDAQVKLRVEEDAGEHEAAEVPARNSESAL